MDMDIKKTNFISSAIFFKYVKTGIFKMSVHTRTAERPSLCSMSMKELRNDLIGFLVNYKCKYKYDEKKHQTNKHNVDCLDK